MTEQFFFTYIIMPGLFFAAYAGIWNNWVYLDKEGFCTFRPSLFLFTVMMFVNTFRFCIGKRVIPFNEVVKNV